MTSVITDQYGNTVVLESDNEPRDNYYGAISSGLEKRVEEGQSVIDKYKHIKQTFVNSKEYQRFKQFLLRRGIQKNRIEKALEGKAIYGATDLNGAAAATIPGTDYPIYLGDANIEAKIDEMASAYGVPREFVEGIIVQHEAIHYMIHSKSDLESRNVADVEQEVEGILADYFLTESANPENSESERTAYIEKAKIAISRHNKLQANKEGRDIAYQQLMGYINGHNRKSEEKEEK